MADTGSRNAAARFRQILIVGVALTGASAVAQVTAQQPSGDYVASLKTCQAIANDADRLACFDRAVGEIVVANDAGEVRIIDSEDIRETRRQLFGLSVPEVGVLERDANEKGGEDELFETTITSVTYLSNKKFRFTTAEGAVWEVNNVKSSMRPVEAGQSVNFKKASFGFYFARINGQIGVKSKRVQ